MARAARWVPRAASAALAASTALATLSPLAQAQPSDQPDAGQRVEITAQPLSDSARRRRDPVAKTVVGRDEIDKYGDTSLGDVLKRLPGVTVQDGSPRLRGLGGAYTLLLVNGEPAPPGFSLDNLAPNQVERIEITRGPSAEHSAQAVAGTINVILREAPRQRQRELRANLGYQALRPTLSANGSWGDKFIRAGVGSLAFTVPVAVYQWAGLADVVTQRQSLGADAAPQALQTRGSDSYWGHGFNIGPRLTVAWPGGSSLEWSSFVQRSDFNNRGLWATQVLQGLAPLSVDDHSLSGGHWHLKRSGLVFKQAWDGGLRSELRLSGQISGNAFGGITDGTDRQGRATLHRETDNRTDERSATVGGRLTWPLGDAHTLLGGAELERKHRQEQRSVVENGLPQLAGFDGQIFAADVLRSAVFAQDDWELGPRWSTSLGLRAERLALQSAGTDEAQRSQWQVVTPVWHLHHKLDAQGRDALRASLTRSFKAPELGALLARPGLNAAYPVTVTNPQIGPDRLGNPGLRPELATGLDLAFEHYLGQDGVLSVGGFHRRIDGLIRNQVTLQTVAWASAPRWVSQPVNLARAVSSGLEIELKGRARDAWPSLGPGAEGLNLRAALSLYRSRVDGLPGPDNRLDQQPPWQSTLGFDQRLPASPGAPVWTVGASLALTPGYRVQQTAAQSLTQGRLRQLDAYVLLALDAQSSVRLSANNLLADDGVNLTEVLSADQAPQFNLNTRSRRRSFNASLTVKF